MCLSVCVSGHQWDLGNFCIGINFQHGGRVSRFIYPHTGVQRTPVRSSQACVSVCLSIFLSVSLYHRTFIYLSVWSSISFFGDHNYWPVNARIACSYRLYISNPWVALRYACPVVYPVVCAPFAIIVFLFISYNNTGDRWLLLLLLLPLWGYSIAMHLLQHWVPVEIICLSISLSLCLSVQVSASIMVNKSVQPVIARSACIHMPFIPQYNLYSSNLCQFYLHYTHT